MQKTNRLFGIIAIIVLLIVGAFLALYYGPAARESRGNDNAEAVLMEFGGTLKNVSLGADAGALAQAIDQNYAPYITPELLADWKANPTHVPGRLTSSPFPERLTVGTITEQGIGRVVTGEVILVTSGDTAGETADTVPYVAQLIPTDGGWKIAAYQEEKVQTLKNIPKTDEDIPGAR